MGRLNLDILCLIIALVVVNCVVQCQYYVENREPIYIVAGEGGEEDNSREVNLQDDSSWESLQQKKFMSRSGQAEGDASGSEEDDESEEEVEPQPQSKPMQRRGSPNGRANPVKLPPNFDANLKNKMKLSQRSKRPLHGDPSSIHQDDDDEGRRPESRLLWPFSIEISKGGEKEGWGPSQHGSYTSWASNGWGGSGPPSTGWGSYSAPSHPYNHGHGWEEEKGLTDEEILKSKHYKKYQKKKKKKIKKLKKKLKFKRLIQKILQKHITYLDKIAPY